MANHGTLSKMQPQHPHQIVPPLGAVPCGVTPDGRQLYKMTRMRAKAVPDIDPVTGEQRRRKNALTGETLHAIFKPKTYTEEFMFYLESEGNMNVTMIVWTPPTPEELAQTAREQAIAAVRDTFFAEMVDSGLSAAEILGTVRQAASQKRTGALPPIQFAPTPAAPEWPKELGDEKWELSDGAILSHATRVNAEAAQAYVDETGSSEGLTDEVLAERSAARAAMVDTPEE